MTILVENHDRVAVITLNDPDRRNTVTAPMNVALIQAVAEAESNDDIGAIVLTGAGRGFCAGGVFAGGQHDGGGRSLPRFLQGVFPLRRPPEPRPEGAGVVRDDQRAVMVRDVLDPTGLDAEVGSMEKIEERAHALGVDRIETELVDGVRVVAHLEVGDPSSVVLEVE